MKTLKKTLCVVLAVVMAVGTLAITASATDFADDADITYDEAVGVLTTLGVIDGTDNNRFDPDGTLTRAQGAKIITFALLGPDTADLLRATSDPFDDVRASSWMAGAVSYCVDQGIIAGVGNNNFDPNGTLTGVAFARMLLSALGVEGQFENTTAWANNVILAAERIDLADGINSFDYYDAITREEACQMALNALFYGTETTTTATRYVVGATSNAFATAGAAVIDTIYSSYSDALAAARVIVVNSGTGATAVYGTDYIISTTTATVTVIEDSLAEDVFGVTYRSSSDASGRTTTEYVDANNNVIFTIANNATLTYTTAVTSGELYNALGLTTGTHGTAATVTVNGVPASSFQIQRNGTASIGGNGTLTEVYRSGNSVSIIQTRASFGRVTNVATGREDNGSVYTEYTIGTGTNFGTTASYKLYTSALNSEEDEIVINGTIARNDYVTIYVVDGVATVTPATMITGSLTSYASATGTYTIGGTGYQMSAATGAVPPTTYNTASTFALDSYGYLLGAVNVTVPTNYVYLIKAAESYALNGSTLVRAIVGTVMNTDGTVATVTLATVNGQNADENETAGLYSYTVNANGAYILTSVNNATANALAPTDPTVAIGVYANASTRFVFANWTKDAQNNDVFAGTTNVLTGYANISAITNVTGSYIDADGNGIAEVVFVYTSSAAATPTNYVYYLGSGTTTDGSNWTYDVIIAGVRTTVSGTTGFGNAGMYSISAANAATATTFSSTAPTSPLVLGRDVAYDNMTIVNNGGLLYVGTNYMAPVASNVPVYTITAATGATSIGTAADLATAVTGDIIICSSSTAITAIYVVA